MRFQLPTSDDLFLLAKQKRDSFATSTPFKFVVFDDFFEAESLRAVIDEFPDLATVKSVKYNNAREKKVQGVGESNFGPMTQDLMRYMNSETFLKFLSNLTGIAEPLVGDPYFIGGGHHKPNAAAF